MQNHTSRSFSGVYLDVSNSSVGMGVIFFCLLAGCLSGHEYAEDNLLFAAEVEPRNTVRENKYQWVLLQRGQKHCTVRMILCSSFHNLRLGYCCLKPAYTVCGEFLNVSLLFIDF